MTTIYVTKYALTKGILTFEAKTVDDGMFKVINDYGFTDYYRKGDYELTMEDAKKKANAMVSKKIDSLRKQINKLETMKF